MTEVSFKCDIDENGRLAKVYNRSAFDLCLKQYSGKSVRIGVSAWRKKRSTEQNSYYWGALIPQVMDGLVNNGYPKSELSPDLIHDFLKAKFLKTYLTSEETGEQIEIVRGTSSLTTLEFSLYIEEIAQWCATFLGFTLLLPNEQAEIDL